LLTDRLQKKDKEVKDLKDLLSVVSNKFDTVFTKYYPKEYVP
jgi:archaellum component FlaC